MKSVTMSTVLALSLCAHTGAVSAKTSCKDVQAAIEAKLKAKGVKAYSLTVVPNEEKSDLRVVGTCEAGAKKILYKRG